MSSDFDMINIYNHLSDSVVSYLPDFSLISDFSWSLCAGRFNLIKLILLRGHEILRQNFSNDSYCVGAGSTLPKLWLRNLYMSP